MKIAQAIVCAVLATVIASTTLMAQNVGVATDTPDAPFHVKSSGQVLTPGGLVLFGNRVEAYMELDFNRVQSLFGVGETPLTLLLQPDGGDIGIGVTTAMSHVHIGGTADQILTLHKTVGGAGKVGFDLLRHNEFSGTDWRIINDGGKLKFFDGIDNFQTTGDLNMIISQGGNVGLGTDIPASHLHVSGTTDQILTMHRTTAGSGMAGIDMLRSSEFSGTDWRIVNDGGKLRFYDNIDNFDTDGDLNMTLTNSGNLGIGIDAPNAALHVLSTTSISETGNGSFQVGSPTGNHLRFDNNEILARNNDSPSLLYLQFWSGNLSLCYDDDGRVGIGNTAPQAKVHITDGGDANLSSGGELILGATNSLNLVMDGNEILARNNGAESPLFLQITAGDVLMVPNEAGQVGIGVTSSANMPSSTYLLAVDGSIIAEEVRVELSGSWPDYVFEEHYALPSLQELEENIQSLGHLPGVPSASVIEEEGFDLGGMQRVMLEKIEELTLYVIDLNKEVVALRDKNAKLEARIEKQEN